MLSMIFYKTIPSFLSHCNHWFTPFQYKGNYNIPCTSDHSKGFGGSFGVDKDHQDKNAVGYEYKQSTEQHSSQKGQLINYWYMI